MEVTLHIEESYSTTFLAFLKTLTYVKVKPVHANGQNGITDKTNLEMDYFAAYAATAKEDLALTHEFEAVDFEHLD